MNADFPRQAFLGVNFDLVSMPEVIRYIRKAAINADFQYIVTPNVDHLVRLHDETDRSARLWQSYTKASLTMCDSRILALLASWSGVDLPVIPGSDLTACLIHSEEFFGLHCHVVGGTPRTLSHLKANFDRVRWTQFVPPPNVLNDPEARTLIVRSIVESQANIVFMSFGFPQSELVCAEVAETGAAQGIALCVGASLEFVTGEKKRAPEQFQRLKLEWLYRLASEPRRLWRRYLIMGPRIFGIWAKTR